jgi:hypothetical protein
MGRQHKSEVGGQGSQGVGLRSQSSGDLGVFQERLQLAGNCGVEELLQHVGVVLEKEREVHLWGCNKRPASTVVKGGCKLG